MHYLNGIPWGASANRQAWERAAWWKDSIVWRGYWTKSDRLIEENRMAPVKTCR
jgi:hypothetical protein